MSGLVQNSDVIRTVGKGFSVGVVIPGGIKLRKKNSIFNLNMEPIIHRLAMEYGLHVFTAFTPIE